MLLENEYLRVSGGSEDRELVGVGRVFKDQQILKIGINVYWKKNENNLKKDFLEKP